MTTTNHPIYDKARQGLHITRADVAKLIRTALGQKFPGVKFSVRSETYSGGGAIRIEWIDGPTAAQVEAIVDRYETKGFDGMIDLAYSRDIWLMPDGSAHHAHTEGTEGSLGTVPETIHSAPGPDAVLVTNMSDSYVTCSRHHTAALVTRAIEQLKNENWGWLEGFDWSKVEIKEANGYAWWECPYVREPVSGRCLRDEIGIRVYRTEG